MRHEPRLRASPCAMVSSAGSGSGERERSKAALLEINRPAAAAGIRPGMSAVHALARCPALRLLGRDPAAERRLARQLHELAHTLAPRVEFPAPDSLLLDVSTLPDARRAPGDWLLATLEAFVPLGVPVRIAMAGHPELASLATRSPATSASLEFNGPEAIITASATPQPVGPEHLLALPIHHLAHHLGPDSLRLLDPLGIQTLGEFIQLPLHDRNERFGPGARRIHQLLHHPTPRPVAHQQITGKCRYSIDFECDVQSSQVLVFHFKRLLESIVSNLAETHRLAVALRMELFFGSAPPHRRLLRLPEPTLDSAALLGPVRAHLESLVLGAPATGIALEAEPGMAVERQPRFFERTLPDPHRLSATLARLESLLGPEAVGVPVRADTHRPDSFRLRPFDPGETGVPVASDSPPVATTHPGLPMRRFRPAPALAVATESVTGGLPRPLALLSGPHRGRVVDSRGPFPLSGRWWEPDSAWRQAEWDIELESGHLLRLAYVPPDSWRLEGAYG